MIFKFQINKHYLLVHALRQYDLPFDEWEKIKKLLWEKFPNAFYLLEAHPEAIFIKDDSLAGLDNAYQELVSFIKEIIKSDEFSRLCSETEKYLVVIKKQWEQNEKEAIKILEEISGLKVQIEPINVFITHPNLRNGINFPQFSAIGWGHSEDWQNYSTIYLCHELMHILIHQKSKKEESRLMHALIELLTDNELRIRLNKKGKYFEEEGLDIGHPYFRKLEEEIMPFWQDYLKDRKGRDIFDLENELKNKIK